MLKVITVSNQPDMAMPLINSLEKFKWHTELLITEWKGFGTKLITVYEFLKAHPEVDRFIFCDAHDVLVLGSPEEFESKLEEPRRMLVSAERGLWPGNMEPYRKYYEPVLDHGYNFVNSGLYYSPSDVFIEMMERDMPKYESDDQEWLGMNFLFNDSQVINMDRDQRLFNSHSFIHEGEYGYENNRVQVNGEQPLFIHFNGNTFDERFNQLIKL
jgi:hypothetical protein